MNNCDDAALHALVRQVAAQLQAQARRLVTAESCTAGWLAKLCTDLPGSSAWFYGGVVVYSNELKQRLLHVPADTLASEGAVSEATVRDMALGALTQLGGEVAVATSGIAGPSGGTPDKPVGTVWCAWAWQEAGERQCLTRRLQLEGDREAVRRQTLRVVLEGLLEPP